MTANDHAAELRRLVRADARLMAQLRTVASLGLPSWCIAAGAVRNLVWDHLHGFATRTEPSDVDVLFHDALAGPEAELDVERRLAERDPTVRWEAVNQAMVHAYTGDAQPYRSIDEAMSRWVDPMTAVGVALERDGSLRVFAPLGLDDLFAMLVRPHLVAPGAARIYRERVVAKDWTARWPRVRVEPLPQ